MEVFAQKVVFLASIPWLSHKSEEKSTDSVKIQWRTAKIREERRRSGDEMEVFIQIWAWGGLSCFDPVVVAQIRRRSREDSARSGENLAISSEDSAKIWRVKLTPTSTDPTVVHRIPIRLDPRLPAVGGGSFNVPPDVSGSVLGWAQTRPGPTRGHPYLIYKSNLHFMIMSIILSGLKVHVNRSRKIYYSINSR